MILSHCMWQVDQYSFRVKDSTTLQAYTDAGVDRTSFTNVILRFYKINDSDNYLELDITDNLAYLYDCAGLTINFSDFGEDTFNGYDYFPDWLYTSTITYDYDGNSYSSSSTAGFGAIIKNIVYQLTQATDWKTELACDCDCSNSNSVLRKWHYLQMMTVAAELCLNNQWIAMMKALYKLTGTTHEFD